MLVEEGKKIRAEDICREPAGFSSFQGMTKSYNECKQVASGCVLGEGV